MPDVRRGNTQTKDNTFVPVQGRGDAVQAVQKATSLGRGQFLNRSIGSQKVLDSESRTGEKERKGERTEEVDELSFEGGWCVTNTLKNGANPSRSLALKTNAGSIVRNKDRMCSGRINHEQMHQRYPIHVMSGMGAGRDEGQRLRRRPGGEIRIPVGTKFRPGFENRLPSNREFANRVESHG